MTGARGRELKKTYATGAVLLPATISVMPGEIETKMLAMGDDIQELLGALDALAAGKVDAFVIWRDQYRTTGKFPS